MGIGLLVANLRQWKRPLVFFFTECGSTYSPLLAWYNNDMADFAMILVQDFGILTALEKEIECWELDIFAQSRELVWDNTIGNACSVPKPEPMLNYCLVHPWVQPEVKF